jgi:hypothetical protein
MKRSARSLAGRVRTTAANSATLDLRRRVAALEAEVQECRALNLRLAELTDVMTDLLIPLAQADDDKLREVLAKYHESL